LVAVAFGANFTEVEGLRDRIVEYSRLHLAWCFGLPPLMGAFGPAVAVGTTRRIAEQQRFLAFAVRCPADSPSVLPFF
jgi:hypothetical protein